MMKIPSIINAHNCWNITQIDVSQHDSYINNLKKNLKEKYNTIINDIKINNSIIGLSQYNLSKEETQAIHMMLILNDNIMLQEENHYAKYIYVNENMKINYGLKAFNLNWLNDNISQFLYKKYKLFNNEIYQNIGFILNTLMGYAYYHKSSISNQNVFNIFTLAKQLFMPLDQFLIALTVLRMHKIINFQLIDHEFNYKFRFCEYISNYIETQLKQSDYANILNDEELLFINTSDNKLEILPYINHIKTNCNNNYILLSLSDINDNTYKIRLRNQICHHSHIIFQPHSFESDKKIMYEYQYVDDINKKYKYFSDYCIFRFIPQSVVKVLSSLWIKYGIQVDFINAMFFLNTCFKKLDYDKYTKFNSNIFKQLGMTDYSDFINILNVLISTQFIDVINLRVANKILSFYIKLKNNYRKLAYDELLNVLDKNIQTSVQQIIRFHSSEAINENNINNEKINIKEINKEKTNEEDDNNISSAVNINTINNTDTNNIDTNTTDINIDIDTKIDIKPREKDIETYDKDIKINKETTEFVNNTINELIKAPDNTLEEVNKLKNGIIKVSFKEDEKNMNKNNIQSYNANDIQAILSQNQKLIIDNSKLLSTVSKLRNFHNKNIEQIKTDLSNQFSITVNNIIKELSLLDNNMQLINSQKNIIKLILNLEQRISEIFN